MEINKKLHHEDGELFNNVGQFQRPVDKLIYLAVHLIKVFGLRKIMT
jgi:hypothetical protein